MNPFIFPVLAIISLIAYLFATKENLTVWDTRSTNEIKHLHPAIRNKVAKLINYAENQGVKLRILEGIRTQETQNHYFYVKKTTQTLNSFHLYGLAVDLYDVTNQQYGAPIEIVKYAEKLGFEWGGGWTGFVDKPHFQFTAGYKTSELLNKINSNQIDFNGFVKL